MNTSATYIPSVVPEYAGNPLIEALPEILSEEEAGVAMGNFPARPDNERHLKPEVRLHLINRIRSVVQPLPIHLELEGTISSLLRSGYVGRNPMDPATIRHLYGLSSGRRGAFGFSSTASTTSLTGLSGMGKTTALNAVLRLYPQTIEHTRYQGREFVHTQIVWLKLECPYDGSLSGLCHAFFRAVDKALGLEDRYASRYRGRGGIEAMIQRMNQLASTYFIGALFIDELQHLNRAKVGGKENMLNFFVNMINEIGIPVVFVGTNSMVQLFADILRNARRASGLGAHYFQQPESSDLIWHMLVDTLWDYQWVKMPAVLTDEIRECLYELTQGITDFLVMIMVLAQRYAIQSKVETLTPSIFRHVFGSKMHLLRPALDALKSRVPATMSKFDDLLPPEEAMNAILFSKDESSAINHLANLRSRLAPPVVSEDKDSELFAEQPLEKRSKRPSSSSQSTSSVSRLIAAREDIVDALAEYGWLSNDALEFSCAYQSTAAQEKT